MIVTATVGGRSHRVEIRAVDGRYVVAVDDRSFEVDCLDSDDAFMRLLIAGRSHDALVEEKSGDYVVTLRSSRHRVALGDATPSASRPSADGEARLVAPMPGKVVRVLVEPGQEVASSQGLVVVEAMKMENELRATRPGTVREVHVREGQAVEGGALLVVVG